MGGIAIDIWENSNYFGSIGSQKGTKNAIFLQGGQNMPPLPYLASFYYNILAALLHLQLNE